MIVAGEPRKYGLTNLLDDFEVRLTRGDATHWRSYVEKANPEDARAAAIELVLIDMYHKWKSGSRPDAADYLRELPGEYAEDEAFIATISNEQNRIQKLFDGPEPNYESYLRIHDDTRGGEPRSPTIDTTYFAILTNRIDSYLSENQKPFGIERISLIGEGTLSRVFLGVQPSVGNRRLVVKFGFGTAGEVDSLGRLSHPNIVPLYWAESIDSGIYMLCMPYYGTTTLANLIESMDDARSTGSARWDGAPAQRQTHLSRRLATHLSLVDHLAAGLQHAHDHDVIHCDVKPGNVLMADTGYPMLIDFNVAKGLRHMTVGGTARYMSPEQAASFRDPTVVVSHQSDIFSLGVILAEMAGAKPSDGSAESATHFERCGGSSAEALKWPRHCPPSVRAIAEMCLAHEPSGRYESCNQLREDIARHQCDLPLKFARNRSRGELAMKRVRRGCRHVASTRGVAVLLSLTATMTVLLCVGGYYLGRSIARIHRTQFRRELERTVILSAVSQPGSKRSHDAARSSRELIDQFEKSRAALAWSLAPLLWCGANDDDLQIVAERVEVLQRIRSAGGERVQVRSSMSPREARQRIRTSSLSAAVNAIYSRDYKRARFLLEELRIAYPDDFFVSFATYQYYVETSQYDRAAAAMATCLALRPDIPDLYVMLGACKMAIGKTDDALKCANRAIDAGENGGSAYYLRGLVQVSAGDCAAASEDFRMAEFHGVECTSVRSLMFAASIVRSVIDP